MLLDRSVSDDVQRALDALPADFRTAVVLCDVEGLSYKEIAEVMDCPVGTVMSRLFRGRRLLQASLEQFAVEQGYVKASAAPAAPAAGETPASTPIDLAEYRQSKRNRS
jgi:RNA polymerase sigma-70 factor (ECF subfamily)